MSVSILYRNKQIEIKAGLTVIETLQELGLSPQSYLVVRKGLLLTENEMLKEGDLVRLVAVISGGSDWDYPGIYS